MANDPKARARAEVKFDKAQRTTDEAKSLIDAELSATRSKMDRLRKQRLAKEAKEGLTEIDKKPAASKKGAARRKKGG